MFSFHHRKVHNFAKTRVALGHSLAFGSLWQSIIRFISKKPSSNIRFNRTPKFWSSFSSKFLNIFFSTFFPCNLFSCSNSFLLFLMVTAYYRGTLLWLHPGTFFLIYRCTQYIWLVIVIIVALITIFICFVLYSLFAI